MKREPFVLPLFVFILVGVCFSWLSYSQSGPRRKKTCLRRFANDTGADHPAHPRSLISAFGIRVLESIIC